MNPNLYIIAGCNGAGKTTASMTLLPEMLGCDEFVNADGIAKGISPFRPEKVAFEAGRIMLHRIDELMESKVDFAFETTLSTKSYKGKIMRAQEMGYKVMLVFFWLPNPELAVQRVAKRVQEGGHDIPEEVIRRRYQRGIHNLLNIYSQLTDVTIVAENTLEMSTIAEKQKNETWTIIDNHKWNIFKSLGNEN